MIAVAAAGDTGLSSPGAPGLWGGVISVSASASSEWLYTKTSTLLTVDQNPSAVALSNGGEIIIPGVFKGKSGVVLGSSFAAARMSFLVGLYLSQLGDKYCRKPGNQDVIGLAYADPTSRNLWSNLTLADAAGKYCPDLLKTLP